MPTLRPSAGRILMPWAAFSCSLLVAALAATSAPAATYTWTNGSGNSTWDTTLLNWTLGSGNVAWVNSNDVVFGSTGVGTVTVTGTQSITALTGTTNGYTLTGGQLTLASATTTFAITTGTMTISSVLSGSNLLKSGINGTLVLSASNALTGTTYLGTAASNGGTLALGNDYALGSSLILVGQAATLRSSDASTRTISNPVTMSYSMTFGSASTGNLLFTGTVYPGTTGRTFTINNAVTEFSGLYSGTGVQTKAGPGTLLLSGSITNSGTFQINAGTLRVASTGRFTSNTAPVVINGATAEFNYNSSTTLLKPITFTQGILSGTGTIGTAVTVAANDTLSPGNSPGSQSFTAGLTWDPGGSYKWEINDAASLAGTGWDLLNVSGGSGLTINSTSGTPFTISITSLTGTAAGNAAGFSATKAGSWTILSSSSGITGFSADKFTLNRSAFSNTSSGTFTLAQAASGGNQDLVLSYNTLSALTPSTTSITGFRVMQNQATTGTVNLVNSGPNATDYALSPSAALSLSGSAGTLASSGTQSITIGYASTATTGARSGTIALTNAGNVNDTPSPITIAGAVVANRVVTASTVDFGVVHLGASGTGTSAFTSAGADDQFTRITVGNGSGGGFTVSGSNGFVFDGSGGSSRTLSGSFATAGALSGTITLTNTSAETGGNLPGQTPGTTALAYSASVFSGTGTWNVAGGGAWGSQASANWTSTGGVSAAPGTFAGYTMTDRAIFAGTHGGTSTILLDGATSSLAALAFASTSNRYVIDQGSGGSLTLASLSGKPTVDVVAGGLHEIKTAILGSSGLQKLGGGTLVLSGSSSFAGGTDLTAGTLAVNGALAGAVNVANGATLGGSGVLNGMVTVAGGGVVTPGNSPGTLTMASGLSLDAASILNFDLSASDFTIGSNSNDLIVVTGDFTLGGVLNVSAIGGGDFSSVPDGSVWRLVNYSGGTFTDNGLTLGSLPSLGGSRSYAIDSSIPGQVNLVIVVPEPGTLALAAMGIAAGALALRRRRR